MLRLNPCFCLRSVPGIIVGGRLYDSYAVDGPGHRVRDVQRHHRRRSKGRVVPFADAGQESAAGVSDVVGNRSCWDMVDRVLSRAYVVTLPGARCHA